MKALAFALILAWSSSAWPQAAPAPDVAKWETILKEAGDPQVTPLKDVPGKLAPVLEELRGFRQSGAQTPQGAKIHQEALLLLMRTQTKMLLPDEELLPAFRELLVVNPKLDETIFNPREKILLDRVRATDTGRLALVTEPAGSTVLYQGAEFGATPMDLPLTVGTYRFLVRKEGYLDQSFEAVVVAASTLNVTRKLRKRTVAIPLAVTASGASVAANGQALGTTQPFDSWLAAIPEDQRKVFETAVRQWNLDHSAVTFFRLPEVPVGEALKLEFRAPCYQPQTLTLTVQEKEVDWTQPILVRPELRSVEMKRDTGFLEVTSVPAGAEVWMDGALQGRTPLGKDVCAGTHRLQLLHPAGQFVTEVVVRQGQVSKAGGELKPALAFVGIYGGDPAAGSLSPMKAEWEAVARRLALRLTTFGFPQISFDEAEALRRKGSLPVDRLLVRGAGEGEVDSALKRIALETGRADLILLGLRSGDHYAFRLYSVLHPGFDEVGVPNLEEASLDFLVSELNAAAVVSARLRGVDLGLGLVDSAKGLVVMKRGAGRYPETGPIKPGAVIRAADQKKMDLRALEAHLRGAKAGQVMNLEVASGEGVSAQVSVQLRQAGTEYPWSTPDGFINSVLSMLSHLREREPLSEEAKYAGLALARGFMQLRDWKRALEILTKTNLEPHKTGICPGTVLYYQGRCYEEMGNQSLARDFYTRAKDYPEGTIGTPDGLSVAVLADRRVQALGSK